MACTSSSIRDCCGGPTNTRSRRSATLNYKATPQCPPSFPSSHKSATLEREIMGRNTCDVVQSGLKINSQERILWRFDCDIGSPSPNNPDVVNRTIPDTIVSRTTTL